MWSSFRQDGLILPCRRSWVVGIYKSTIDKLISMRLTAMSGAFRIQMDDTSMKNVPFEDRFGMLVDVEYTTQ